MRYVQYVQYLMGGSEMGDPEAGAVVSRIVESDGSRIWNYNAMKTTSLTKDE